jgi:hypothetical protein
MTPVGNGFSVTVSRQACQPTQHSCTNPTTTFSGASADGMSINWSGAAPKPTDLLPNMGNLMIGFISWVPSNRARFRI